MPERPARAAAAQTPPSAAPPPAVDALALDRRPPGTRPRGAARSPGKPSSATRMFEPIPRIASGSPSAAAAARTAGEPRLGLHAAEEARRSPDPPGREARERRAGLDRAVFRRRGSDPSEPRGEPADAGQDDRRREASRDVVDHHAPAARQVLRAAWIGPGFTTSKKRKSTKDAIQAAASSRRRRVRPEERHGRAGHQLAGDLVDHDAPRILGPSARQTGPDTADADEPDDEPGHQESDRRAETRRCDAESEPAGSGQAMARPTTRAGRARHDRREAGAEARGEKRGNGMRGERAAGVRH